MPTVEENQTPLPLCPHIRLRGNAGPLSQVISMAAHMISQRDCKHCPVYANLLIEQKEDTLEVIACRPGVEMSFSAPILTGNAQPFLMPAKSLQQILASLPQKQSLAIDVEKPENNIVLHSGELVFQVASLDPNMLPRIDHGMFSQNIELTAESLSSALDRTLYCAADNDVRHYLNGIHILARPGTLSVTASNGSRLSRVVLDIDGSAHFDIILPVVSAKMLQKELKDYHGAITLSANDAHATIRMGNTRLTCQLIDATYPDISRLLDAKAILEVLFSRQDLQDAVNRCSAVLGNSGSRLKLTFEEGRTSFETEHSDSGYVLQDALKGQHLQGTNTSVYVDAHYLLEALKHLSGIDNIALCLSRDLSGYQQLRLKDLDDPNLYTLLASLHS